MKKNVELETFDPSALEETLAKARKETMNTNYEPMGEMQFYFSQFHFIRKRMWLFQGAVFGMIYFLITYQLEKKYEMVPVVAFLSALAPLLLLINVSDSMRYWKRSLLEIEMTTKNRLSKVMMTRASIFGIVDLCLLFLMIGIVRPMLEQSVLHMALYSLVPFNVMCIGCLLILGKGLEEQTAVYCLTYGILLLVLFFSAGANRHLDIYSETYISWWIVAFIFSLVVLLFSLRRARNGAYSKTFEEAV
ncbi:hypothetical protein lbkm_4115 [Lachnospiraceae bacterium KM106-2]|nr:hypothetical protein lbkm_4115 [Lachnospiraceae bacterium KM106-2]